MRFGDGTAQRSLVKQLIVNFSEPVNFAGPLDKAFTLFRDASSTQPGTVGAIDLVTNPISGPTSSVTITFAPGPRVEYNSLIDGYYDLTVDGSKITGVGGNLDISA